MGQLRKKMKNRSSFGIGIGWMCYSLGVLLCFSTQSGGKERTRLTNLANLYGAIDQASELVQDRLVQ